MTAAEAQEHVRTALSRAKPGCYATVSPQALALVLAASESKEGESVDGTD